MIIPNFQSSTGWRRRGLALLLGLCAALALPPLFILPLLFPAFSGLFLLIQYAPTRRQAFLDGWWWGLGYFVAGLYWMCISLYVEPEKFAWLTPFALFGVPSVLAIYTGLTTLALYSVMRGLNTSRFSAYQNPCTAIIVFAAFWVVAEMLRSVLFTGFPWNLIGYVWTVSTATIQLASLSGIYGLSWLTVLAATIPALFIMNNAHALRANGVAVALLALMTGFGFWRMHANPTHYTPVSLRIVQGNIAQDMKWDPETQLAHLQRYVTLMQLPGLTKIQAVIWPESAIPYMVMPHSQLTHDLGSFLPAHAILLAGGERGEETDTGFKAWNSFFAMDAAGDIVSSYDKHHLVPFGEFIPLRNLLPVEKITGGMGDFSRGKGPQTLISPGLPPYSPLICYEAIFPWETTDKSGKAQWLVNITNDGWFGNSSGPYQHLEMARLRAVEQGLPLIRAANTGISVVFDGVGRELARLPLGRAGVLDNALPQALGGFTFYSRNPFAWLGIIFVISILFIRIFRK